MEDKSFCFRGELIMDWPEISYWKTRADIGLGRQCSHIGAHNGKAAAWIHIGGRKLILDWVGKAPAFQAPHESLMGGQGKGPGPNFLRPLWSVFLSLNCFNASHTSDSQVARLLPKGNFCQICLSSIFLPFLFGFLFSKVPAAYFVLFIVTQKVSAR